MRPQVNVQVNNVIPANKTSWDQVATATQSLNQSIGRSLSPISFKDGISISGSWMLFLAIFWVHDIPTSGYLTLAWFLSLFIKFR